MKRWARVAILFAILIPVIFSSTIAAFTQKDAPPKQDPKESAAAQQPAQGEDDESLEPIKVGAEVVLVNVLVTDTKNRYVERLTKDEFELYEDGKKQELSFFTKQDE